MRARKQFTPECKREAAQLVESGSRSASGELKMYRESFGPAVFWGRVPILTRPPRDCQGRLFSRAVR